ncbi:MAG: glycoprotease [Bacteroidetes bacterium]|nr:MAG: glycoprotease [Bacteroidota bacterium]
MAAILLIETATQVCSAGLCVDNHLVSIRESFDQRSHAELITTYISEVINEGGLSFEQLDAVAVSKGPGSYTGLRIGVSTAKGICFACDIPLISIDTLQALAFGMKLQADKLFIENDQLFCPMIDARRMEVYTAIFDSTLSTVMPTTALVIEADSLNHWLVNKKVCFAGDGSAKCNQILSHENACFIDGVHPSVVNMVNHANQAFSEGKFENLAYFEPFYLKDFVAGLPKVKGLH